MSSCEGIPEARERISARCSDIAERLTTNYDPTQLPAGFYMFLFDPESEQSFVHILSRQGSINGEIGFSAQSIPYRVSPDSNILDAVGRMNEAFKHREIVLLCDSISATTLTNGYTPKDIGRGRFRISRPNIGVVDYYIENAVVNKVQETAPTHFQNLDVVLR